MNKRQKQVIQSQLNDERATLNKLKGIYKKALDDVNDRLAALKGRAETENLQSVIYQIQYQEALKKQINGILDTLNGDQFSTISEYLAKSYESGFVGAMYDIHGQGVPLIFPIDQDQVVQAVTLDTKLSKPLYNKLGEDVNLLKKRVANNISRGIAQGQSYSDIAKNIAVGMVGNYARMNGGALYNAMRITRTEAHRISQQAAYDALKKAKDNGADVVKQWDATLDKRTRPSHARVDGEIRELDEPFSNGLMRPGDPRGRAAEVINCRCQLLQRARCALDEDELDELKDRAAYFGLDKTANFEEFRRKYMPASIANSENSGIMNLQSLKSISTSIDFSDLSQKIKSKYGVTLDTTVQSLDFDGVRGAMIGVESVIKDFPDVGNFLKKIETCTSGVMSCSGDKITFNPKYFTDIKGLKEACKRSSTSRWWIQNSSIESIGAHEAGHGVEWALIQANPTYSCGLERTLAWNNCTEAQNIVSQACKNIKKTPYGKGKKKAELIESISRYASSDASEILAEAFADLYANKSKANPLSQEIYKLTVEQMKKYKGVSP